MSGDMFQQAGDGNFMGFSAPSGGSGGGGNSLMDMFGNGGDGGFASSGFGMVAQAILGGLASQDAKKEKKKDDQRNARQRMNDYAFQSTMDDWYKRRDKAEWRSASKDYQQFSNISKFAPNYRPTYQPAALGAIPTSHGYVAGNNNKTNTANNKYQQAQAAATVGGNG